MPKDGKDGKDGEDGFDLRHFDVVQIDERSFMLRFKDLNAGEEPTRLRLPGADSSAASGEKPSSYRAWGHRDVGRLRFEQADR